jgi:hypothetical protein
VFLAKLLQVAEERMIDPKAPHLPVFCYIDEADDYIGDDANVEAFLDKARKQNVSLTFAIQSTERIISPSVQTALKRCALQAWVEKPPHWNFTLPGIGTAQITLPDSDFSMGDLISDADFEKLKLEMWHKYGGLPVERPKSAGSVRAAE